MRAALALLVAALVAVPGASAYRNPTAGAAVILQIPGMHRAQVRRDVVYQRAARLRLDVYRPRGARGRLPAVLIGAARRSGQAVGWGQLLAASGLAAVAVDARSERDARTAIGYVRSHARRLGIDAGRLCTLGFSSRGAFWFAATLPVPKSWVRCNVVYYGALPALPTQTAPLLVAKAERDRTPGVNDSIDRSAAAARGLHADVRVVAVQGRRGFDVGRSTRRGRAVVKQTLRFLRARLGRPLPLQAACLARAEQRAAFRFFAADDTPLAGAVLGSGPRGVVLAHSSGGDLCNWFPYARQLAAAGYRVLAYDSRGGMRVDLDVAAAVEALRRTGSEHVVAAGASIGAAGALIGSAALASPPAAVVSLSAPASYGPLRALPPVRRLRAPVFFAASSADEPFVTDAREMYAASGSTERRLDILPGGAHGERMLQDAAFRARVTAFIAAH